MGLCKCSNPTGNTGQSDCFAEQVAEVKEYWVPKFSAAGVEFKHNPATLLDQAYLTARINDLDPSTRWRPIHNIKTVTGERGDADVETFDDKTENDFDNALRSNAFVIDGGSPELLAELKKYKCVDFVSLTVDKDGNLIGVKKGTDGMLYGQEVDKGSLKLKFIKPAQNTRQKISVAYNYMPSMKDENLVQINATEITADLIGGKGLYNIYALISAISTTGATVKVFNNQGSLAAPIAEEGLVITDFVSSVGGATGKVRNQTDAADVTIATFNETVPGTYALTWVAQTSADVLIPFIKKNGRDGYNVKSSTIVIP